MLMCGPHTSLTMHACLLLRRFCMAFFREGPYLNDKWSLYAISRHFLQHAGYFDENIYPAYVPKKTVLSVSVDQRRVWYFHGSLRST